METDLIYCGDNVEVLISFEEGEITAVINDNGIGFQLPGKVGDLSRIGKLGLVGMEESDYWMVAWR